MLTAAEILYWMEKKLTKCIYKIGRELCVNAAAAKLSMAVDLAATGTGMAWELAEPFTPGEGHGGSGLFTGDKATFLPPVHQFCIACSHSAKKITYKAYIPICCLPAAIANFTPFMRAAMM